VDGHVYVTDAAQMHLKKFTASGEFVKEWGEFGAGPGQFYKPKGLGQDLHGNLYVIDFGNHRGQIFTPEGAFLMVFGEEELRPPASTSTTSTTMPTTSTTTTTSPPVVHDIVCRFAPSQPAFKIGSTVKVSVVITNVGNATETVRVTLTGDINFSAVQNVTVPAGASATAVFDYPVPVRPSVTLTATGQIGAADATPANNSETKTFSTTIL